VIFIQLYSKLSEMNSICDIVQKQKLVLSEPTTSNLYKLEKSGYCISNASVNIPKIKYIFEKCLPYFTDLKFKILFIKIIDVYDPIKITDISKKNILIPLTKLKNDAVFNNLFNSFQDACGVILINFYKLQALSAIFQNVALNIMFDLATNGNNSLDNPCDFYEFLKGLRNTINNNDLHQIIKLGVKFHLNFIVFRNHEPSCIFYQNAPITAPLVLFRYISLEDIKFCSIFKSFDKFRVEVEANNVNVTNYC
jgi:hypothetical protein